MRIVPLDEPFDEEVGPLLRSMTPAGQRPIALFRTFAKNRAISFVARAAQVPLEDGAPTFAALR